MNDLELEFILTRARLPEFSEESPEKFSRAVVARLKSEAAPLRTATNLFPRRASAFALAACLLVAFVIGHRHGPKVGEAISSRDLLANTKLIRELLTMFPKRVRAIVEDAQGLKLVLSDIDDVPSSQPLYVHLCDGKHCSSFVTFSGQEIQIRGQKVTALSDAHGGIIVTGDQFVWSSREQFQAGNHLTIEARTLESKAM